MMKYSKKKASKCFWPMKDKYTGLLRPSTLPQVITEVVNIGILRPSTIPIVIAYDIIVVILVEADIGPNRPATLPLLIREHQLML